MNMLPQLTQSDEDDVEAIAGITYEASEDEVAEPGVWSRVLSKMCRACHTCLGTAKDDVTRKK